MANPDLTRLDERRAIIEQIEGEENITRKRFEQRKFDIYRNRQANYVLERLNAEFSPTTVRNMRKVLSINPCKRIIDQMASLYSSEPKRYFANASESELEQLENLYYYAQVDMQMRLANRYYKLHDQSALWIVPRMGKICMRALTPKDYDVIPDDRDPERAYAYVMSVWDLDLRKSYENPGTYSQNGWDYYGNDQRNQKIADDNDRMGKFNRYVFWTEEMHFTTDGLGDIVGEVEENPIQRLPFVDIALEKDFQFFVRRGNDVPEFTIDLLAQLSDLTEISRLQGHSQAIIYSVDEPKDVVVGPNKVMYLRQDPNPSAPQPKFEFASPSPDLASSLEILNSEIKMFLSSKGLDPAVVSGKGEVRSYASGVDHLLANMDKFQASKEDMDLFRWVEGEAFDLMRAWSNVMQPVTDENQLIPELQGGLISDSVTMEIKFSEPHSVRTQTEVEDSVIKRLDAGLVSKEEALKELYGFDEDKAKEYMAKLNGPMQDLMDGLKDQSPSTDDEVAMPAQGQVTDVRKETLNGAQIEAIVSLAQQVGLGNIAKEAAVNIISVAFNLDTQTAASMLAGKLAAKETNQQVTSR